METTTVQNLRTKTCVELLENEPFYRLFWSGSDFQEEVELYKTMLYNESSLRNALPIAAANTLGTPIVILCGLKAFPVIPITPRISLVDGLIWLVHHNGHYKSAYPLEKAANPVSAKGCKCGRGKSASCNTYRGRCPCYQSVSACSTECKCIDCENQYGQRPVKHEDASSAVTTPQKRVRRKHQITTKSSPGNIFLQQNNVKVSNRWSLLESLLLEELITTMVEENIPCDIASIAEFYLQMTQTHQELKQLSELTEKSEAEIKFKIKEFEEKDAIFRATVRSQINLID